MELDYKAIGKRIKIARIKADLTQERLAELIDISPTHLSNIETGTTRVSLNTIISIANALSVTGDDLLCDNIIMSKVQFEKDIALLLEDCDEYEIRIIKDMIGSLKDTLRRDANLRTADKFFYEIMNGLGTVHRYRVIVHRKRHRGINLAGIINAVALNFE